MTGRYGRVLAAVALGALAAGASAQSATRAPALEVGRAVDGRVEGSEARYSLRLAAGQTVRIVARGRGFDAQLRLYGPAGSEALAEDDDSGGGTTAELTFQAERAGLYQVAVSESGTATGSDAGAPHTFDLAVFSAPAPAPVQPIAPNTGRPTPVDMARCGGGCRFSFQAREGDRLIAETSADDQEADPVLELRQGATKIAEDDDGGEGVNARIVRRIPRTGTYTVLARTTSGRGSFALAVALRTPVVRTPTAATVGTPISGSITADSELTDEGRFYNSYVLRGRAGQRLQVDLESSDFDAALSVFGETALGNVEIASNDDAEGVAGRARPQTLNSRLLLTFARDGVVELRAVSLNEPGAYTLRIGDAPAN